MSLYTVRIHPDADMVQTEAQFVRDHERRVLRGPWSRAEGFT